MLSELAHIFLIISFLLFFLQLVISVDYNTLSFRYSLFEPIKRLTFFSFILIVFSFSILILNYVQSDFSILNVYNNSHTNKPLIYKISGSWGNHEGSLLMWLSILSIYGLVFLSLIKKVPKEFSFKVLVTLAIVNLGFIGFTIFTSNPFLRTFPVPDEGLGLNPVLQDPGLAFHPPLLYLGYVGLTIPFSYSIAALLQGKVTSSWAKLVRPWILTSWIFLTLGITLGSWWAYYELGWGGWWFWDPVENVSLLPWLLTTALLHSVRVTEKRDRLKSWTILLCILSFSLTLLGTFIVRSGLLTSVHAFASDPARGIFILSFLVIITAGSLLLYAIKLDKLEDKKNIYLASREGGLLLNNIFLCASASTILLGTLWPLIIEAVSGNDISVGAPYFKIVFLPLILPAVFLSGISINLNWKKTNIEHIYEKFWKFVVVLIFIISIYYLIYGGPLIIILGVSASIWLFISIVSDILNKLNDKSTYSTIKLNKLNKIRLSSYGMYLAHLGVGILILGISLSEGMKTYYEGVNEIKSEIRVSDYTIKFNNIEKQKKENWISETGVFLVKSKDNAFEMKAERRLYLDTGMPSTEAAIKRNLASHLYIVMGQEQPTGSGYRVIRIYYNPNILFIWLGAVIMALGGLLSLLDGRLHSLKKSKN
ncbi:MAG: Cytochrome c-type biogenesis protein CcmF [Alphaproteobacteria bacterium MarineAlpha9_Bin4]|nr:MAG: Cytochrome c-type biogenesis protein CcmF [Alphaproteobacteria bacterium MarineAlpha9_Bin4]